MSDKRYVVPDKTMIAVTRRLDERGESVSIYAVLNSLAEILAENPIVPTDEQIERCFSIGSYNHMPIYREAIVEWQRRMFLAPEPEIPEEIKDLLCPAEHRHALASVAKFNADILEAYRRGQKKRT